MSRLLKLNQRHGHGEQKFASGDAYRGSWKADKMHGDGEFEYSNGESYTGSWKESQVWL